MATNEELLHQLELLNRENERLRRTAMIQATRIQDAQRQADNADQRAAEEALRAADADQRVAEEAQRAADADQRAAEEAQRAADADQRAAEEAQRAADADQRAADADQRAADADQRARAAEEQLQPTDYLSYLSLCHHKLFMSLDVQTKSELTSAGGAANVKNKRYPLHLKKWVDFPTQHSQCQERFQAAFGTRKIFQPAYGVDMVRDLFSDGPVADEEDMKQFQCFAVEAAVKFVANKFLSNAQPPSNSPTGPAKVRFLNNPYGLLALDFDDAATDDTPAYVPTMNTAIKEDLKSRGRTTGDSPQPLKRSRSSRARVYPDQWCFQVSADDVHVPVFVIEYKAAHKFPTTVIVEALRNKKTKKQTEQDSDSIDTKLFIDVIRAFHNDKVSTDSEVNALVNVKTITAQVITQAFHYMVEFGLCYAYVASGEALLLLNLQPDDPRSLYYHLALPNEDVSSDTTKRDGAGNLYNTAVALVSSLVLMGCETPVLTQRWKQEAYKVLKIWPDPYPEVDIVVHSGTSNDTTKKPSLPAPTPQAGCSDPTKIQRRRKRDDNDDSKSYRPAPGSSAASTKTLASLREKRSTPSTSPGSTTTSSQQRPFDPFCKPTPKNALPYCTQACLLGVRRGGPLDWRCPNVRLHACAETPGRHPLTTMQLVKCMRAQLAEDLDGDCEGLDKYGKFGATSMLFRLVLRPYGYSFVGKGVQRPDAWLLEHERGIYETVAAQQGQLVPVCLGLLELVREYISYTGAHISHMLLLSYGGEPMWKLQGSSLAGADEAHVNELIKQAWARLGALGVMHGDERTPNVVWSEERQAVMCIDFGMAQIRRLRERSPDRPCSDAQSKRQRTNI